MSEMVKRSVKVSVSGYDDFFRGIPSGAYIVQSIDPQFGQDF